MPHREVDRLEIMLFIEGLKPRKISVVRQSKIPDVLFGSILTETIQYLSSDSLLAKIRGNNHIYYLGMSHSSTDKSYPDDPACIRPG